MDDRKVIVILRKIIKSGDFDESAIDKLVDEQNLRIEYEQKSCKSKVMAVLETI